MDLSKEDKKEKEEKKEEVKKDDSIGLKAMSDLEKLGATVFYGKAGCFRCHKGAALSSVEFHAAFP